MLFETSLSCWFRQQFGSWTSHKRAPSTSPPRFVSDRNSQGRFGEDAVYGIRRKQLQCPTKHYQCLCDAGLGDAKTWCMRRLITQAGAIKVSAICQQLHLSVDGE